MREKAKFPLHALSINLLSSRELSSSTVCQKRDAGMEGLTLVSRMKNVSQAFGGSLRTFCCALDIKARAS